MRLNKAMSLKYSSVSLMWFIAVILWLSLVPLAQASNCVAVTGVASMDGVDRAYARQMAIRNGLELASMQNNLHISARSDTDNFQLQNQAN
uniref:Uncharacterized protein n=1 Tax=uncultured microorganism TaxID=358574 RepID=I2FJH5_9ZZZZ|nr:hypothetical protein [uncultured microorganism]